MLNTIVLLSIDSRNVQHKCTIVFPFIQIYTAFPQIIPVHLKAPNEYVLNL